jgi:imidazolonepropionase-like amidohydrolase
MLYQSIMHYILRAAILAAPLGVAIAGNANTSDLAMTHARIVTAPEAIPIEDGTILIHDGRITAVAAAGGVRLPRTATRIDLHGRTVMAGFWNSHVHLMTAPLLNAVKRSDAGLTQELTQMLTRWGFTTVFDTASQLSRWKQRNSASRRRICRPT